MQRRIKQENNFVGLMDVANYLKMTGDGCREATMEMKSRI